MSGDPSPPPNLEGTTLPSDSHALTPRGVGPDVDLLVIAWCPDEPERLGEVTVIPSSGTRVVGRGATGSGRANFVRLRPGNVLENRPPLSAPGLSRRQIEVSMVSEGMQVVRVGSCTMRVNGVRADKAVLRPGDTLRFRQSLVLLHVRRPARIQELQHLEPGHAGAFGAPDAWGIVGESPAVWALRDRLAFAAKSGMHVLLTGESGTGKELAANAVYRLAGGGGPFVSRNAATFPEGLIAAELFGSARNFPSSPMPARPGVIGQADGGFVFLDEIGELPLDLQSQLLRVLDQGGEYQRLGESEVRRSRFRLIAATNRDPSALKHDLLARFPVRVEVPSLAQRREDIPLLVRHLVARAADRSPDVRRFVQSGPEGSAPRADAAFVDALLRRELRANTRDLDALLWQAMAASTGETIVAAGLPRDTRPPAAPQPKKARDVLLAKDVVERALADADGSVALAAEALGLRNRHALYRQMKTHGLATKRSR